MLHAQSDSGSKRRSLQAMLKSGNLLRFPGAFSPLVARLIEQLGFEGVYVSGAVLSADLGLPDIGMTTLSEVAGRAATIARVSALPTIVDIDTGFGEPLNVARTIQIMEDAGLVGCHLEDQRNPKRCGHLDHKQLVPTEEMCRKVQAAVQGRRDRDFLIIARSDARSVDGLDAMIERCRAYVDAGADAIFPEALQDAHEFEAVRNIFKVPLIANMTEFGKSKLLTTSELKELGVNLVIYPVTTLRIAMGAVERGLRVIAEEGIQESLLDSMQTRRELYDLLDYQSYEVFDQDLFNFGLPE